MTAPSLRPLISLLIALVFMGLTGREAAAQSITSGRLGIHKLASTETAAPFQSVERSTMPRWVKWGLIGAAAGAVTFGLLGGMDIEGDRNATKDAAVGAVFGFAILGGAIAFYDWVCKPDSSSERAGLC